MITVIITSYKEEKTIGKAIDSVLKNNLKDYEILVVAPDEPTIKVAEAYGKNDKRIKVIKDPGEGKPVALNLAVSKAKGDILILTDGDVYVGENSLNPLISFFKDEKIGAVSGNPISLNSRTNMLGFWAYVLSTTASKRRKKAISLGKKLFCSGYLFAIRKELFPRLPEGLLSEDGFISNKVYERSYRIGYSEKSLVYIKYPTNFNDWIIQKKRSAGGYNQIKKMTKVEIRSFKKEASGVLELLRSASNAKELFWLFALFIARVYLWGLIYIDINLKRKDSKALWKRVTSTK
jgi:cellulose synthase/poly-beta-1,6-N-acetylglucosamine synthase-like glycosyltransferase